jgi:hypothetical protein
MASITGKKAIFFVTSPRTPLKMLDEIKLLIDNCEGHKWNKETQTAYAEALSGEDFFEGSIKSNLDFAARDRINRAPKALGFVDLKPVVKLTDAGNVFLSSRRPHEIFTRQLLKFQLPSPNHLDNENKFGIKPYLELLRLLFDLETLSKDEIAIFVMQLTHVKKYNEIKRKIIRFRKDALKLDRNITSYNRYVAEIYDNEIINQFRDNIARGDIATRESGNASLTHFTTTKKNNHKDYADACIRYLRATNLVTLNPRTFRIYIPDDRITEVKFILNNVSREPEQFTSEKQFKDYLFASNFPQLLNDNERSLINSILSLDSSQKTKKLLSRGIEKLKDLKDDLVQKRLDHNISTLKERLEKYEDYEDIMKIYESIEHKQAIEPSLLMEWNTWRAFLMLDDGNIT